MKRLFVASLVSAVLGCGSQGSGEAPSGLATTGAQRSGSTGTITPSPSESAAPTGAALIAAEIDKVMSACEVAANGAIYKPCKDAPKTLRDSATRRAWVKQTEPADAYLQLCSTALGDDPKRAGVALSLLAGVVGPFGDDEAHRKRNATADAAARCLDALEKWPKKDHFPAGEAVTEIALRGGAQARLFAVAENLSDNFLRYTIYHATMETARMAVFPDLKKVASAGPAELTAATLWSFVHMMNHTDAEKAEACPWAKGYLGDPSGRDAGAAGSVMSICGGEYVDALLDEGPKREKAKGFDDDFGQAFAEICFEFVAGVSGKSGREAQCERNYAFLESVANDATVEPKVRGQALWNIYYQRRDKKILELMRRYESHKVPEIAARAKDAIKTLTEAYKLK